MCAYLLAKERSEKDFARQAGAWGEDPHCYPPHVTYWVDGGPKGPKLIESESQADEFLQTSLDFFQVCIPWLEYNEEDRPVCRLTSKDFQEIIQRIASMYGAVARYASDEALSQIDASVSKQFVQAVLTVIKRETSFRFYLKSGVIKEPGQTVIDSCVGWFRLDSFTDAALENGESGLVGTICKLALDPKRPPSPIFMTTCVMICENVAKMTRGLADFQLAMDRGVLLVGISAVAHANAAIVKHAARLLHACTSEPLAVCKALAEGTTERRMAEQVAAMPGVSGEARAQVTGLLGMLGLCEVGLSLKDSLQWVGEEAFPLPRTHNCAHCRAAGAKQRCSRCNEAYYCSGECQRLHWREHKVHCAAIPQQRQPDVKGLRRLSTGYLARNLDRCKQRLLAAIKALQETEGISAAAAAAADVYASCRHLLLFVDLGAMEESTVTVDDLAVIHPDRTPRCVQRMVESFPGDHADLLHAVQTAAQKLQPKQVLALVRVPGPEEECCLYVVHVELRKSGKAKKKKAKKPAAAAEGEAGARGDVQEA